MRAGFWRRAAVAAALVAALGACSDDGRITPSAPDVSVDTPELRAVKAEIGMEDCVPGDGEALDDGLPEVTLPCLGGGTEVDLSSLRGPLVINLWQAFCEPCKREMPALEEFHQTYGDRVPVLGIDFNDVKPGAALELARETGATYPSLADPGGELMGKRAFQIASRGLPAFVLIDADGEVVQQLSGGVDTVEDLVDMVRTHLGVDLTAPEAQP